jgi:ferric-dicitrate binding protein FerR (iron transport regulator)
MNDKKIINFIKGNVSPQEKGEMLDWIGESKENENYYLSFKADWLFNNLPENDANRDDVRIFRNKIRAKITPVQYLMRIAAILLIPVLLFSIYQYFDFKDRGNYNKLAVEIVKDTIPEQKQITLTYTVNPGVKGLVNLPDGSKVWLNSKSTLKTPNQFDSTARIVELSGEGYFSVESNRSWPMYVKTSKGITVKVTGTEFNLTSYDNDNELKLTLVSGEVTLIRERNKQEIAVRTMEEVIIPDDIRARGRRGAADVFTNTAWKDGFLIFDNVSMEEVIKRMERWYGVTITTTNPKLLNYSITAQFKSESITQVLRLLEITSNVGYNIKDNNVTLFIK